MGDMRLLFAVEPKNVEPGLVKVMVIVFIGDRARITSLG
jgi:hypothetical protein